MACRILINDGPESVQLHVSQPLEAQDIETMAAATIVALDDGHRVVVELAVGPVSLPLLRTLADLATIVDRPDRLRIRGVDEATTRFLRVRGLDRRVRLELSPHR